MAIQESRSKLQDELETLQQNQSELQRRVAEREQQLNQPIPQPENPSVDRIPTRMDQQQERSTQWVRATYPYTDAFRAPIRSVFENLLPKSKAADHFTKWSNRYTMVKAWQFRSGYRMEKSGSTGVWRKADAQKPLRMFVLRDSFKGVRPQKGSEPWTRTTRAGRAMAEEYFTLIGFAHREFTPLFSKILYPVSSTTGITSYAQAIFYNANDQQAIRTDGVQQKLGWDTLNWDPAVEIPEWAAPPTTSNQKWPWEVFSSSAGAVKVKLNWQAKLMPVTPTRLENSDEDLSGDMANNVSHAIEYFEQLGRH